MLQQGLLEYIFTIGIIISAIALFVGVVKERKNIRETLGKYGFRRSDLFLVVAIVLVFAFIEIYFIKPTQLLFFDDAIYQGMALDLIHMGQAWMCNYGTPLTCLNGQVYHEPIGLSANMALGFLLFGVRRSAAYGAELALGVLSVFMSFFASLLLLKSKRAAYFTALLLALSPVLLVWAMPTNSDLAVLAYSLVAVFFMMLFIKKKTVWSFSNLLFSFSLLMYMKVDEIFFIPIFLLFYILLDDRSVRKAIGNGFRTVRKNFLNTKLLVILLFFVFAIAPSVLYSYNESRTDTYGYQGTVIQNTCTGNLAPVSVTGPINLQNFGANICANITFWFNQYKSTYIMQPILFTALAIIGFALMFIERKHWREAIAVGVWFLVFFLLYTAFYAGSVIYGVDWRFQLSLIAQVCVLGGFCLGFILEESEKRIKKRFRDNYQKLNLVVLVVLLVIIFYPIYALMPQLSVNPSTIQQAGDARFYEGFVYNNSALIPPGCVVYTYDPTLFNINNRTATQIDNLYNSTQVKQYRSTYQCLVLDYGYWCHTPNNECQYANKTYNLTPIATATYKQFNYKYGFYIIK